jgi:hypothetical protein
MLGSIEVVALLRKRKTIQKAKYEGVYNARNIFGRPLILSSANPASSSNSFVIVCRVVALSGSSYSGVLAPSQQYAISWDSIPRFTINRQMGPSTW